MRALTGMASLDRLARGAASKAWTLVRRAAHRTLMCVRPCPGAPRWAPALVALGVLGVFAPAAPTWAQIDEAAAEHLMHRSGLWEQLGATAAGARAGIETASRHRLNTLTDDELHRLLRAVDAALAPTALRAAVRKALAERMAPVHLPPLQAWLDSDLGRRITALEVAAARPDRDSERALRAGIARLDAASAERRQLLEQLVEATRAAEAITRMTIDVAVAVQRGMASVKPDGPVEPVAALRQAFEGQRAQMMQAYRGMSLALFAEMYQALPDGDLARYVDFLRGAAGGQYLDATMQAMERALVDAAERLGSRLPGVRPGAST